MMKRIVAHPLRMLLAGAVVIAGILVPACVEAPPAGTVYASFAPPTAQIEVVGTAPGPDFVWVSGHHVWHDSAYHWQAGRWERRPHANARWVAGSWNHHHKNGWYWKSGHWK